MLNDELFTLLAGASAITTDVATRIYPVQAPEDFQYIGPFVIFSRISNKSEECHAGSAGLATARYQISAVRQTERRWEQDLPENRRERAPARAELPRRIHPGLFARGRSRFLRSRAVTPPRTGRLDDHVLRTNSQ
jgi:hypothetical protein